MNDFHFICEFQKCSRGMSLPSHIGRELGSSCSVEQAGEISKPASVETYCFDSKNQMTLDSEINIIPC